MSDIRRAIRHILFGALAPYSCLQAATPSPPVSGTLPTPCQPAVCGANARFVTQGTATATYAGKSLTVNQATNTATLNWANFNIAADGKVSFVQPSKSAVALNRIYDANPSQIFGNLSANGQVYLINANGFLFGSTTRVNVGGLLASTMNLTDRTRDNGILSPVNNSSPALEPFTGDYQHFSDNGPLRAKPLPNKGTITIEHGAQLNAADGGRLLLAGGAVDNAGSLTAPDGQVILAGGQSVYLQASPDNALRGLIVQVDAGSSAAKLLSSVVNESTAQIATPRGNVTLAGLMINQDGRISATTSVAANGSVTLSAGTAPTAGVGRTLAETQGGQITIGADSDIEILPELSDTAKAVDLQVQLPSTITMTGQKIILDGGTLHAPSGTLNLTASSNPASGVTTGSDPNASLRIDAGTRIDLSGSDATLPMDANLIQVQLRSNEFADDPTQRNGALRGQTVTVDIRADGGLGSPIANLGSAIASVGKTIAQRTEAGGTANLRSAGDIVFAPGASIDVSGGKTTYLPGSIQTTKLVGANGQLYDIGSANPLLKYTGVVNPTFTTTYNNFGIKDIVPTPGLSSWQPGYIQGARAGTVQFVAPSLVLQGKLAATATPGPYQRAASGTTLLGGQLIIGAPGNSTGTQFDYLAPPIEIVATPAPVVVSDSASLPIQTLQLPSSYLTSDGFGRVQLESNTSVQLPAGLPLNLPAGTTLQVQAARIDIDSSISSLGGALSFQSEPTVAQSSYASSAAPNLRRLGIGIGDGVTLDVSGQWTNDSFGGGAGIGSQPTLQNGGAITLQLTQFPGELVLGNAVSLRANGGAWEQSNGALSYGAGGKITLDASPAPGGALQLGSNISLAAFGVGTAQGGTFTLDAPRIDVAQGSISAWTKAQRIDDLTAPGGTVQLFAPLLQDYGFSNINLIATGAAASGTVTDTLTVEPGSYRLQARTLQLDASYPRRGSGGEVLGFSKSILLPDWQRPAANLALGATRLVTDQGLNAIDYGSLDVRTGASILGDPGASVDLLGAGNIFFGGHITAPSGKVSVKLLSPSEFGFNGALDLDPGYLPDLGITLGAQSLIDVSAGGPLYTPNNQGLLLGTLRSGGSVAILADRGKVVTDPGSRISFSGNHGVLDVRNPVTGGYTREVVGTSAGSLQIGAVESLDLLGSIQGSAGLGTAGAASGGSLEIDLARFEPIAGQPGSVTDPLVLNLVSDATGAPRPGPGSATLGLQQILNGTGVDALTLNVGGSAPGEILFSTGQALSLARSLNLETQTVAVDGGVAASVHAPVVSIGNPSAHSIAAPAPAIPGSGSLSVDSQLLTLVGNVSINGTQKVTLGSAGDIQLQGTYPDAGKGRELGSLTAGGDLTLLAQRVYPDTYTSFAISSVAGKGPGTLRIDPALAGGTSSHSSTAPLSADGVLTVTADQIEVGGSLFAPFGQINLNASRSLQLTAGSLVSVSGAGLEVPYGLTQADGKQWVYRDPTPNQGGLSGSVNTVAGSGGGATVSGTPGKNVQLTSPNLKLQSGATVDLSGGGNLYAYEWVPGTGGTQDRLAGSGNASNIPGLYAIIPSQAGMPGLHDPQESGSFGNAQTVYLSGGAGVAAGYYALLPPRFGLLPGARLIQGESTYTSPSAGQIGALGDGTPVIAGYLGSFGTSHSLGSTLYQGFAIYSPGYAQRLAAYTINQASDYFSAQAAQSGGARPALPADAGLLALSVAASNQAGIGTSLAIDGKVLTSAAAGGRGAQVSLSAPELELSARGAAASGAALPVSADVLQSWNAGSITLGGTLSADGSTGTVAAHHVVVDGGVSLSADQIVLMAHDGVEVHDGATLASTSGQGGKLLAAAPASQALSLNDPGAAVLALSDLAQPLVTRAGGTGTGTVQLDAGSTLSSGGALLLDGPGAVLAAGTFHGKGASWSLGSDSIAFVGAGGAHPDTLNIDSGLLQALAAAGSLRLASQGSIDLLSPVSLGVSASGSPTLNALTLVGSAVTNSGGASSTFGGTQLSLGGVSGASVAPVAGTGALNLVGNALNLESNTLALSGFSDAALRIAGAVTSTPGSVGGVTTAGNLSLDTALLTPGAGATTTLTAGGSLRLGSSTQAPGSSLTPQVGGALVLNASDIQDAGRIAALAGVVKLRATAGDIHLGAGSSIDVSGTLLQAVNQSAAAPGGTIALDASGNVALDSGSALKVSGAGAAPAGRIGLVAGGSATLAGSLLGRAGAGGSGGDFTLDAAQLTGGFTPLAANLTAGGFTDGVDVRVHHGDLALSSGTLSANSIALTADSGSVDIGGVLNVAAGGLRGQMDLSGQSVILESGASLHADGAGASGLGGEIILNASCPTCAITLAPGSQITAAGSAGMGRVVLRAAATADGRDVQINGPASGISGLGADLTRAGQVIIEPVRTLATASSTIAGDVNTAGSLANAVQQGSKLLGTATPGITAHLLTPSAANLGSTPVSVQAGVELVDANAADATLTLPGIDLTSYSVNLGQVINVGVRAAGSIAVNGTISDGFITDPTFNTTKPALSGKGSASFNIIAGADSASANPLATLRGSTASLTLLSSPTPNDGSTDGVGPSVVRTGTGDINLAAAGNIIFGTDAGGVPSVYTAGLAPANVVSPAAYVNSNLLMNFGAVGGSVRLNAGGRIQGAAISEANPKSDGGNLGVTGWLLRQGNANLPGQYGVDYSNFDWNVGSFGGGDVRVTATGSIDKLSAAVADSYVSGDYTADGHGAAYGAGGGLSLHAGGDIGSPQLYVADGTGVLTTDGAVAATLNYKGFSGPTVPVGAGIALGNSPVGLWTRTGLQVDAIYDPMLVAQTTPAIQDQELRQANGVVSYGPQSAVLLSSTSGDVLLRSSSPINSPLTALVGNYGIGNNVAVAAPSLGLQALQGNVLLAGGAPIALAPRSTGQLSLFAAHDIMASQGTSVQMADNLLSTIPTVLDPALAFPGILPFSGVIHGDDPNPVHVTSGRDISGLRLQLPKSAQIVAGRDIVDLSLQGQNISPNDITFIAAGRDYLSPSASGSGISVGGPGSVDMLTGRNLDFGFGPGVVTVGNLLNPNLPTANGADIALMVGYGTQGADPSAFVDKIVAPSTAYQGQLVSYVESLNASTGLSFAQARAAFGNLSTQQQSALVHAVFFNELLLSGRDANSGSAKGFTQGYAAIDTLFPRSRGASSPYTGDLTLSSSRIYTDAGGNISILVPGGKIDVGLANTPPGVPQKPASQLGIVAEGAGNVDIYALNDVNVNSSRIFTLGGGDILIWSTLGNIDAGNGSKSSLSVPPPTITISNTGVVSLNFGASLAQGSGIRTIQVNADVPPGNVDLDAPAGTVNAGDAGIGASGNINIAAAHVVGVDNINFGGTATGVPSDVSSLGASLSGASSAAAGTTTSSTNSAAESAGTAKETAPIAQAALSWLDVFVTGLGEENCKQDDVECLKRQRTAAP